MKAMKRIFAMVLCLVFIGLMPEKARAESSAGMTADEFIGYLKYVVDRGDSKYGSGGKFSSGYYDGTHIYFDCWGLGESILATKGRIVYNKSKYQDPYDLYDTSIIKKYNISGDAVKALCQLSSDFTNIVPGEWLFRDRANGSCYHIGYYIGDGKVIEATSDGLNNTQISTIDDSGHSNLRGSKWTWTSHAKVPWIDYNTVQYTLIMPEDGLYQIRSVRNSNYGIDIPGGGDRPQGTVVHGWEGNETSAQVLGIYRAFDEWYKIVYNANGLLLNVQNGNGGLDGRLWLWPEDYTDSCYFRFLDGGNGTVIIQTRLETGNCLDLHDADEDGCYNGQRLHLWFPHDGSSCRWILKRIETERFIMPKDGLYQIRSARNTSYGIDIPGGGNRPKGTAIHGWEGNESSAQVLGIYKAFDEWYKIVYNANGLLMNVKNGQGGLDGRLWLWPEDYTDSCYFRFLDGGNGTVIIQTKLETGNCLDLHDADKDGCYNGQRLHLWFPHDGSSCRWYLKPV